MKKPFILILSILFSYIINSQENEVIFILYDDYNNLNTKRIVSNISNNSNHKQDFYYYFYFNQIDNIRLWSKEYANFDEMERENPTLFFKVKKSFLRNNKDMIITKKKMLELGFEKTSEILHSAKTIFLIDKNEIRDGKIIIKEVSFSYNIKM